MAASDEEDKVKARVVLLGLGVLITPVAFAALFFKTAQVSRQETATAPISVQDTIGARFTLLAQRGEKVQTTPLALPPPAGVTLSPSGDLIYPRPPALDEEELERTARARLEQTPLAPRVKGPCKNDPELFAYIAARKDVLKNLQAPAGASQFPAMVNFKRPVDDAELASLVVEYRIRPVNLSYVTNSDSTGGFCFGCDDMASTEERLHNDVDSRLRVEGYVYVTVLGTPQDLRRLDTHPDIVLVDPGTAKPVDSPNYKYVFQFPDAIFWRYEEACR